MASSEEEQEQERIWQEVFRLFDKDKNGTICQNEIRFVLRALNHDPTQKQLQEAMATLGKNGKITYEDFRNYMKSLKMSSAEERKSDMLKAFQMMDKNGDRLLDANELLSVLTKLGEPLTTQEAEAMIKVADVNKDGKIDYEEFVDFLIAPYLQSNPNNERRLSSQRSNMSIASQPNNDNHPHHHHHHHQPSRPPPPPQHHSTSSMSQQSLGFNVTEEGSNNSLNNYFRMEESTDSNYSMRTTHPEITDTSEDAFS